MLPIKDLRLSIGDALAADTAFLAPVAANKVALVISEFTPNENLVLADLTLADFDGSTPLAAGTGTQQVGVDPVTGDQLVTIKEPAGGWRWITTGLTNLPQVVWGYALVDNGVASLIGAELLPQPLSLTIVGLEVNLGRVQLRLSQTPFILP